MFSVSPEIYSALSLGSRWLFVFIALLLLFFAFSWLRTERKSRRDRFRELPGAGTIGELTVVSGSDDLRTGTWFPLPREGVLGSLRSCDLVVPCPGVRSQHLDFSWRDGTGLLIRPRPGCGVLVDGVPVDRRSGADAPPMIHGSCLQVGEAVLRLQLFSALDHTNRPVVPAQQSFPQDAAGFVPGSPAIPPYPDQTAPFIPAQPFPPQEPRDFPSPAPENGQPAAGLPETLPGTLPGQPFVQITDPYAGAVPPPPAGDPAASAPQDSAPAAPRRRRRSDRWKEDWSE